MLNKALYLLAFISAFNVPKPSVIRSSVSDFVGKRIDKYWKGYGEKEVFLSNELRPDPPNISTCDLVVYNNSAISSLGYGELDNLLLKASNSLKTLGIFAIDIETVEKSIGYKIILEDPEELWNYNFVNVEKDDLKILSELESSIVFFISPKKINKIIKHLKSYFFGRKILGL